MGRIFARATRFFACLHVGADQLNWVAPSSGLDFAKIIGGRCFLSTSFDCIFFTNLRSGNLLAEIDVDPDEDSAHFTIRDYIPVGEEDKDLLCFVWRYEKKTLFKLCSGKFSSATSLLLGSVTIVALITP